MTEPKSEIYSILSEIGTTYQMRAGVMKDIPCLIYHITSNVPVYSLDKEVEYQVVEVTVDIYANSSQESGSLFTALVGKMLENDYRLVFSADIPDDNLSHITTVFNLTGY